MQQNKYHLFENWYISNKSMFYGRSIELIYLTTIITQKSMTTVFLNPSLQLFTIIYFYYIVIVMPNFQSAEKKILFTFLGQDKWKKKQLS